MTEQQAIKRIKDEIGWESSELNREAFEMGVKALEKQILKKPRFYAHNYYCTECGNLVGNNEFKWQRFLYCDKCGQKLDWGNEDAE